jgi:single-strand DNA-binding protein
MYVWFIFDIVINCKYTYTEEQSTLIMEQHMLKFSAIGHLGQDAKSGTGGSQPVVNFSVGCKTGFGDRKKDYWVDCALWGQRGEKLLPYLVKGQQVYIEGEGGFRTYQDRSGKEQVVLTIHVDDLELLGGAKSANGASTGQGGGDQRHQGDPGPQDRDSYGGTGVRSVATGPAAHDDLDDSIPF